MQSLPDWDEWALRILDHAQPTEHAIFVGHSMGGRLAAKLACDTGSMKFICLDAAIPPEAGEMPPVEYEFLKFLQTLPLDPAGNLPPWHDWWPINVFEGGADPDQVREQMLRETRGLPLTWFSKTTRLPDWSKAKAGFIRTSPSYKEDAREALSRGWPVEKLIGTHLHPISKPDETAEAIIRCCQALAA